MNNLQKTFSIYLAIGLMIFAAFSSVEAQRNSRNERELRKIVRGLNAQVDDFRYNLGYEFNRTSINEDIEKKLNNNLRDLQTYITNFDDNFRQKRENADDVNKILNSARSVNDALNDYRLNGKIADDWASIRQTLDRLAANYQISANWNSSNQNNQTDNRNQTNYPVPPPNQNNFGLSGTYQLDATRSENAREIAEQATRNSSNSDAQADLENKLAAPDQIVVEVRGNQVTLSSSNAAPITFAADGRERTENLSSGKTIRVRATLRGDELTVASLGGDTDYTVVFASIENGKAMRVTRRITTDYLSQTVFAESIYQKTDSAAQTDNGNYNDNGNYSSSDEDDNRTNNSNNYPATRNDQTGNFIVPNGTTLTGLLQKDIDTKISQNNDRFELLVQSPDEYRGAVIEGYVSGVNRSGRVSGRSQITFNFERIRTRDGRTYDFAGNLQNITDVSGKTVKIDTEGTAKGDSQTKETLKRGGIGAGIGAVIGAIIGGGKGALIGAGIGGGAGAGSVVVQGKDDLQLKSGSTITVQSSSPNR